MIEQNTLRHEVRSLRDALEPSLRQQKSIAITNKLIDSTYFKEANTIAIYHAYGSEVATQSMIDAAWKQGKHVAIPRIIGPGEMIFLLYTPSTPMLTTKWGITEVDPLHGQEVLPEQFDMMVLPGLVFSPQGDRIGYGGGFYDRYQTKLSTHCKRLAVAFDCQIRCADWLIAKTDLAVDYVLTESTIYTNPKATPFQ